MFQLKGRLMAAAFGLLAIPISAAQAKVSEAEAARLGTDLTPIGSERAGNADGTIPAWEGGITTPPAGYTPGGYHVDPFAGDAILFTIDSSNRAQYEARLTGAHKALLSAYPDTYKMNVYPTRRSCALPEKAYEWNRKNAVTGEIVADGNGIANALFAVPFPIPQSGIEVLWNHLLRYRGFKFQRDYTAVQVRANGPLVKIRIQDEGVFRWSDPSKTRIEDLENISIYFIQQVVAPTRLAGNALLVHETINQQVQSRLVWSYNPGQRRVRRAPDIQYDNPGNGTDGMSTSDALNMYNGAPDRYTWELLGKQEAYIPYNSFRIESPDTKTEALMTPKHMNPDYIRYELHRVWQVEGKLRPDSRHIYARRVFYMDEDSWFIVASELYDARGEAWRIQEAQMIPYYEVPTCAEVATAIYDLQDGGYYVDALVNETKPVNFNAVDVPEDRYQPQSLRTLIAR
ncbi:MAG: DUF1329 domain-containing protein [Alphaproteobacteria bacterium]|nr:DUF1329 domain-containing protein [Alphaproteobacteria bacterium]